MRAVLLDGADGLHEHGVRPDGLGDLGRAQVGQVAMGTGHGAIMPGPPRPHVGPRAR